jgi:DNA polymerase-3 subunit delta
VPLMARRVRDVLAIAERLEAGEPQAKIKGSLKMSPWAADRRIAEARRSDVESLRRALVALADLEHASRGGEELEDDTVALRAIGQIAA